MIVQFLKMKNLLLNLKKALIFESSSPLKFHFPATIQNITKYITVA